MTRKELDSGIGGEWRLSATPDRVVHLAFGRNAGDGEVVFEVDLAPEVAMQLAEGLIDKARAAGFRDIVSLTIGGAT